MDIENQQQPQAQPIVASEVSAPQAEAVHPSVGVADRGLVLDASGNPTGERVVYDYDEGGKFIGWHKEVA